MHTAFPLHLGRGCLRSVHDSGALPAATFPGCHFVTVLPREHLYVPFPSGLGTQGGMLSTLPTVNTRLFALDHDLCL